MNTASQTAPAATTPAGRIKALRRDAKLTQAALAAAAGVAQSRISLVEAGARRPSPALLAAVAARFGVPPGWLACGARDARAAGAMTEAEAEAAWLHAYRCLPKAEAAGLLEHVLMRAQAPEAVN